MTDSGVLRIGVDGETIRPGKVAVRDLTELAGLIQSGLERMVRLLIGESGTAPGPLPSMVRRSTELLLTGIESGSATLVLELPPPEIDSASEEESARLFEPPALDLGLKAMAGFVEGLHDLETRGESVPRGWDNSVMEIAEKLSELAVDRDVEVRFEADIPRSSPRRARIAPDIASRFAVRHLPTRRRRTARGELILVDLRSGRIDVEEATGRRVKCEFDPDSEAMMSGVNGLIGEVVVASGEEEYDPASGRTGKLELTDLERATDTEAFGGEFWDVETVGEPPDGQERRPVASIEELASDETFTDEEYEAFLEALRDARRSE